jgi:uncharacterized protein (DUF302 family)
MSDLPDHAADGIVTKTAAGTVTETVARLIYLIASRGMTLFTVVDHSGEARRVGLELRETKVVIFGNPLTGTPIMQAAPLAALDLPLKILVWDDHGRAHVSYARPELLAARYHLSPATTASLSGIVSLVDELTNA